MNIISRILFFILLSNISFANQDFTWGHLGKRFIVNTASSVFFNEGNYLKGYQLYFLLQEEESKMILPHQHVEINFSVYNHYFDETTFAKWYPYCMSYEFGRLTVNVLTDNTNLVDILKLIDYGLKHTHELEKYQKGLLGSHFHGDYGNPLYGPQTLAAITNKNVVRIKSIPQSYIAEILNIENPVIGILLSRKLYRRSIASMEYKGLVDYYTQNDSFYIFNAKEKIKYPFKLSTKVGDTNKNVAALSHIYDFTSDGKSNYLIFITPDSFYNYVLDDNQLLGPVYLPKIGIAKHDWENEITPVSVSGDTIVLRNHTFWGVYYLKYNEKTGKVLIDSNTFPPEIKKEIAAIKSQKDEIIRAALLRRERRINILVVISVAILVNGFLLFTKKL